MNAFYIVIAAIVVAVYLVGVSSRQEGFSYITPGQPGRSVETMMKQALKTCVKPSDAESIFSGWKNADADRATYRKKYVFKCRKDRVTFFKNVDFAGQEFVYAAGEYPRLVADASKAETGYAKKNDLFSSLIVPRGFRVTVYADWDLLGVSKVYLPGFYKNFVTTGWNDRISSFKVEKTM